MMLVSYSCQYSCTFLRYMLVSVDVFAVIIAAPFSCPLSLFLCPSLLTLNVSLNSMDLVWPMPPGTRRRLVEIMEAIAREAKVPSL